jgi:hypothetical protein
MKWRLLSIDAVNIFHLLTEITSIVKFIFLAPQFVDMDPAALLLLPVGLVTFAYFIYLLFIYIMLLFKNIFTLVPCR